ncbi:RNA-directed DNA polymerase from mobile element jockey [Eumeta japonica]|uniref:RNA-directed DNA polymerase from mobile element jockey n=1 Tax=Eumeta variegata TaxID=151549 RepID=A0A4C1V1Z7_EUMVA|nr:RNA-directed DNA polymerase from mobile element jockey [Eumeta japonica]
MESRQTPRNLWEKSSPRHSCLSLTLYCPQVTSIRDRKPARVSFCIKASTDHRHASSYSPITLLNIIGKLCEQLILRGLTATVERLQPRFQYGFTKAKGTATKILRTSKIITYSLANGDSVSIISSDLSKDFDSIDHKGLIKKLQDKNVSNDSYSHSTRITSAYLTKPKTPTLQPCHWNGKQRLSSSITRDKGSSAT